MSGFTANLTGSTRSSQGHDVHITGTIPQSRSSSWSWDAAAVHEEEDSGSSVFQWFDWVYWDPALTDRTVGTFHSSASGNNLFICFAPCRCQEPLELHERVVGSISSVQQLQRGNPSKPDSE
ncbi:unnamed protein product [Pleuronectes platessa]|uniref:Uncharacterized protein n=1 Tax=Pleuronectes platessa TaxID=8262 RepID=A0A9N7YQ73_PLEPL|nr:unnamed protein product [Pleuronectes platessa]